MCMETVCTFTHAVLSDLNYTAVVGSVHMMMYQSLLTGDTDKCLSPY